jgi:hypothetical protein
MGSARPRRVQRDDFVVRPVGSRLDERPETIAGFTTASMDHYHYENGVDPYADSREPS